MAILDIDRNVVVVRIIYDGPPFSGKTTSVYQLSNVLGHNNEVYTPEELSGRTLYFDWMEYIGGLFQDRKIACQVVSVPGQISLKERRDFLIQTADVVVFVVDASNEDVETTQIYLNDLLEIIAQQGEEATKVVIQANKQDVPGALSSDKLYALFADIPDIQILETTATAGKGLREAFVVAVRLAIQRIENLMEQGKLIEGTPEVSSGKDLLVQLQQHIKTESLALSLEETNDSPVPEINETQATPPVAEATVPPNLPCTEVARQWIWPPVTANDVLERLTTHNLRSTLMNNVWIIQGNYYWRCFSKTAWLFDSDDKAKSALRQQIKIHLQCSPFLSEKRCIIVSEEGFQNKRLWQVTPVFPSLDALLTQALQRSSVEVLTHDLLKCAAYYIDAYQQMTQYGVDIVSNLEYFGLNTQGQINYLGCIDNKNATRGPLTDELLIDGLQQAFAERIKTTPSSISTTDIQYALKRFYDKEEGLAAETLAQLF